MSHRPRCLFWFMTLPHRMKMRWERATPVALFLSIKHSMSATGVARSQP